MSKMTICEIHSGTAEVKRLLWENAELRAQVEQLKTELREVIVPGALDKALAKIQRLQGEITGLTAANKHEKCLRIMTEGANHELALRYDGAARAAIEMVHVAAHGQYDARLEEERDQVRADNIKLKTECDKLEALLKEANVLIFEAEAGLEEIQTKVNELQRDLDFLKGLAKEQAEEQQAAESRLAEIRAYVDKYLADWIWAKDILHILNRSNATDKSVTRAVLETLDEALNSPNDPDGPNDPDYPDMMNEGDK